MTRGEKLIQIAENQQKVYEAGYEKGKDEGGVDVSDATASADEIFAGKTAYTVDGKVTGTFTIDNELTAQDDLITELAYLVASKRINTCTIELKNETTLDNAIVIGLSTLNNKSIETQGYSVGANDEIVVNNVICGSAISILDNTIGGLNKPDLVLPNLQMVINNYPFFVLKAPSDSGANVLFKIEYDQEGIYDGGELEGW